MLTKVTSSLLDASSAMLSVLCSLHRVPGATTIPRKRLSAATITTAEMVVGEACNLLLDPLCSQYREKLVALIESALPIENILADAQLEAIRR